MFCQGGSRGRWIWIRNPCVCHSLLCTLPHSFLFLVPNTVFIPQQTRINVEWMSELGKTQSGERVWNLPKVTQLLFHKQFLVESREWGRHSHHLWSKAAAGAKASPTNVRVCKILRTSYAWGHCCSQGCLGWCLPYTEFHQDMWCPRQASIYILFYHAFLEGDWWLCGERI